MYLARQITRGVSSFYIRESYFDSDKATFCSRDLVALGSDPHRHIAYPGGNSYYIDDQIYEKLSAVGVAPDPDDLETIFLPFIRPDIRLIIERFAHSPYNNQLKKVSEAEQVRIDGQIAPFDRRRLHYLRYGAIDQGRIHGMPQKLFRPLLDKSRDEKEEIFKVWENDLAPTEYRQYVYVIFDLQRFFPQSPLARRMPQGLNQAEIEEHFMGEFCGVAADKDFWLGADMAEAVPIYLQRYLVMFYDFEYGASSALDDYLNNFMNSKRFYNPQGPASSVSAAEVSEIFGEKQESLRKMSSDELTKLYRQRAQELHPDKGGEHEEFVRLSEAYRSLMKGKN